MSTKHYKFLVVSILMMVILSHFGCKSELTGSEDANPYIQYLRMEIDPRTELNFVLLLPEIFDPSQSYPALLALPPGEQTMDQVEWGIDLYYKRQSIQRNWIVVSPAAVNGISYFAGSEVYIPMLLELVETEFNIEEDKWHIAGVSNGGVSAFHIAVLYPELFQSVTVFPGVPLEEDKPQLDNLVDMPITMYVGAFDDLDLIEEMESTVQSLQDLGASVHYQKWANDGHVISSISSEHLFDLFDGYRFQDSTQAAF
jgi:hypothetical protein